MIEKIFYLCDGQVPKCTEMHDGKGSARCFRNGGGCRHTSDPEHAINFESHGGASIWEKTRDQEESEETMKTTECKVVNRETGETVYYTNVVSIHEVITEDELSAWQIGIVDGNTATFHRQDWQVYMLDWVDAKEWR